MVSHGKKILKVLLIILFSTNLVKAEQLTSANVQTDQTQIRLFSALESTGKSSSLPLGIELLLKPGWKTYWRSPGDAGFPLTLELLQSENVKNINLSWPVPHRFELFGLQTFGYDNQVVFPIDAELQEPGKPAAILLRARYLVCEKICIPYEADLQLTIPAGSGALTDDAALLNKFRAQVPNLGSGLELTHLYWDGSRYLTLEAKDTQGILKAPDLLVEGPQGYLFGKPEIELTGAEAVIKVEVIRDPTAPDFREAALTLTLIDGKRGIEHNVLSLAALPLPVPMGFPWWILAVALLGGLILNAMPCVLPVLILKLTSIADMIGQEKSATRKSFIATAAGILFSFSLIALFLMGLKSAGHAIGWGVQFQQPFFLAALIAICLVFAVNLIGGFTIPLPAFLSGISGASVSKREWSKPFLTGCLATLMATPCSAPFVGTAVGFALSGSNIAIAAIFSAMGLGLALPYLFVAALPGTINMLPRPGKWMGVLKKLLALSLIGTAIWLGLVMAGQLGLAIPRSSKSSIAWQDFDRAAIAGLVEKGKVVFVDVTADWCLTCLANEKLILEQQDVREKIEGGIAMRADWTEPNEAISSFLADYQRYGIPFNIVYGPNAKEGIILPELLTPSAVIDALNKAK